MVVVHFAAIYLLAIAISLSTAVLISALWGVGGLRVLSRRVNQLDDDVTAVENRLTKDQKRRAADLSHTARTSTKKADEILGTRVAQFPQTEQVIPGR